MGDGFLTAAAGGLTRCANNQHLKALPSDVTLAALTVESMSCFARCPMGNSELPWAKTTMTHLNTAADTTSQAEIVSERTVPNGCQRNR
jgi:hypothetical protein